MYKLFLCLRYLRRRIIAYFAMLGVALSVALLVGTLSVMNGFVNNIERAAKGLFGDIVIETASPDGIAKYDELIAAIRKDVPDVEAGSPFILSYGWLQIPGQRHIRPYVQIAGIRLPERAAVTDFAHGLYVQQGIANPTFDPNVDLMLRRIQEEEDKARDIYRREKRKVGKDGNLPAAVDELLGRLNTAVNFLEDGAANLRQIGENRKDLDQLEAELQKASADANAARVRELTREIQAVQNRTYEPPENRVILGLGLPGLSVRTDQGETVRILGPGSKIVLNILPLGRSLSATEMTPNTRRFSIVDDCRTDVWPIDSQIVYIPFETIQLLNNMDQPDRCSQIHLKVRPGASGERRLMEVARQVQEVCSAYARTDPEVPRDLDARTWRQMQESIISSIQSQRTLAAAMFGISALVCVVLIFVIFYMIVLQKTREIGVMKAVGASGGGVAAIFLGYGAAVGLVGAAAGTVLGMLFVHYINPIHDWLGRALGFQVWSRKQFMFERIPNAVDWTAAAFIVMGAILAGLVGALIPAIRSARMQPVEALRYE
jgi:lipoprotein-releasing system permease protein